MKNFLSIVAGMISFIGYWLVGSNLQDRLSVALGVLIIAGPTLIVGWLLGKLVIRRFDVDGDGAQIFAWTALVFWIFPAFGFVASQLVYSLAEASDRHQNRYLILSFLGLMASVINCALGVMDGISLSQPITG